MFPLSLAASLPDFSPFTTALGVSFELRIRTSSCGNGVLDAHDSDGAGSVRKALKSLEKQVLPSSCTTAPRLGKWFRISVQFCNELLNIQA